MTILQHAIVWALRIVVLWAAVEASATLYAGATTVLQDWRRIEGHRAAMEKLEQRLADARQRGQKTQAEIAILSGTMSLPSVPDGNFAAALREELLASGAQAPAIDLSVSDGSETSGRLRITARWREGVASNPGPLQALAERRPALKVQSLRLSRVDATTVTAEVSLEALMIRREGQKP